MLDGLQDTFIGIAGDIKTFVTEKPITSAGIALGTVGVGTASVLLASKGKAKRKTRKKTTRGRSRDRKFISKQKHEIRRRRKKPAKIYKKKGKYISRKPLRKSSKRLGKIYKTKNGQPYKIMASGKARFIKRKGGRR